MDMIIKNSLGRLLFLFVVYLFAPSPAFCDSSKSGESTYKTKAEHLLKIGNMESMTGNQIAAKRAYLEAEKLYRTQEDWSGLAKVLLGTGNMESINGNERLAQKAYMEAEKLYRAEKNWSGLAKVLLGMGNMESVNGKLEAARKAYLEAEKICRDEQNWLELIKVLHGIAELENRSGNSQAAMTIYNELSEIQSSFDLYKQNEPLQEAKKNPVNNDDGSSKNIMYNLIEKFFPETNK
ncbi:MAG: tetratricopeptide repeat protein [Candidatus Electrothrix sp. MAN1_4]|nr:tetratricopeptide repeat protein [Candidatus Electrothrix sp. MAN1_4]